MRLLLIEDEARIVELVTAALGRAGFVVDAVNTCADGKFKNWTRSA
jgi:DNA-binding response OmpR family regulator